MLCFRTPLAVIKDGKIVKNQNSSLKVPLLTFSEAMSCLDAKLSLAPSNQLIVPSTSLAPGTHPCIQTGKPQTHKDTYV